MGKRVEILVVDDEPAIRHAVEAALVDEGYLVRTAGDGVAALSAAGQHPPDAIILDLRMPVLDGFGFLARYQTTPKPRAAIIVCSTASNAEGVLGLGADAYLRKPFDIDDLIALIDRLVS